MSKPHEETWTAEPEPSGELWMVLDAERQLVADTTAREDAARLMAQAPAMARLLLKLQWAGRAGPAGDVDGACVSCERERPEEHAADCELVAVLRAADVLP